MKNLRLPDTATRPLPFYLAMEEYATRLIEDDDLFFMWQVEPTVIFGRNQMIDNEVNIDYCRSHGIAYYRRKSGGGCVFADMNNIMFSYITRSDDVSATFSRYTGAVVETLRALGLNASDTSRNDILIDGQKVSGNAFYHTAGFSIVHGTMLYDTDMTHITRAITPSRSKMQSKGVKSVASRITTIRQHCDISLADFKQHVLHTLCNGERILTGADIAEIETVAKPYFTPEFILGHNPRCTVARGGRIDGVGEIAVSLELNHNTITYVNLSGDYFQTGDVDSRLINRLKGTPFTREAVEAALSGVSLNRVIHNLDNEQFINLIFNT